MLATHVRLRGTMLFHYVLLPLGQGFGEQGRVAGDNSMGASVCCICVCQPLFNVRHAFKLQNNDALVTT